ncbi:MAG TPA: hypothetical protein VIK91_08950 [Nannocystis sp.]
MSEETKPTPDALPAPASPAPAPKSDALLTQTLRALQTDNAKLAAALKKRDQKLAQYGREVAKLRAQLENQGKRERESAIVGKLRTALPHLGAFEARAALIAAAEEGKVDRYSDKPDDVVAALVEIISSAAPALARPPGQGGGPNRAPQQTPARKQTKLLI